jgi:hypothetical protein
LFLSKDPTNKAKALEIFWKEVENLTGINTARERVEIDGKFFKKKTRFKKKGRGGFLFLNL